MVYGLLRFYDKVEVGLVQDKQLIFMECFDYTKDIMGNIFNCLQAYSIPNLNVIMQPLLVNRDCPVLDSYICDGEEKFIGFSREDLSSLNTLVKALNVEVLNVYSAVDFYKTLSAERCLVVDSSVNENLSVAVIEGNSLLELVICRAQVLESKIKYLSAEYKVSKLLNATNSVSVSLDLGMELSNYNHLSSADKIMLAPSLFTLVTDPSLTLEGSEVEFFRPLITNTERVKTLTESVVSENKIQEISDKFSVVEVKPNKLRNFLIELKGKKNEEVEHVVADPAIPWLSKVLTICVALFVLLFGTSVFLNVNLPESTSTMARSVADSGKDMVYIKAYEARLDRQLSTLRSGAGYYSNTVNLVNKISMDGKVTQISFDKEGFTIHAYMKDEKVLDKFSEVLSQNFNIYKTKQLGSTNIGGKSYVKVQLFVL
jgi:hypothetical protein